MEFEYTENESLETYESKLFSYFGQISDRVEVKNRYGRFDIKKSRTLPYKSI